MRSRSWVRWGPTKEDWRIIGSVAFVTLLVAAPAPAQFFKVYPYKTADAGAVEVSYWTTFIPSSDGMIDYANGSSYSREDLWAHSLELEYGLSHKLTIGYYADFLRPEEGSFDYIQSKLLARYRLFEKYELPVDLALYGEYVIPDRQYSDAEKLEFRFIIEKDFGPWRVDLNPILEKVTSGPDIEEGLEFAYAAGIYYENMGDGLWATDRYHVVPGLEFYGSVGELAAAGGWDERQHYIFPVVDVFIPRYSDWKVHWSFGPGFGISDAADDLVFKSILTAEFIF
ncbi:MAG: hypothetical protein JW993_08495 [Sedimentisphaerales bacterium]|nr:hypothetical protein [Sedimentisphaerales bacterium]